MSDERFNRIEDKVDKVDDKVNNVKYEIVELRSDFKSHMKIVEDHVTGDNKIIEHISPMLPILPELADMVRDHSFKKERNDRYVASLKIWSMRLGIIATAIGIITGIVKLFS